MKNATSAFLCVFYVKFIQCMFRCVYEKRILDILRYVFKKVASAFLCVLMKM
jgi:hypothetical protein